MISLSRPGSPAVRGFRSAPPKSDVLPPEDLARLRARLEDHGSGGEASGQIVFFFRPSLLGGIADGLREIPGLRVDSVFFLVRGRRDPLRVVRRLRVGRNAPSTFTPFRTCASFPRSGTLSPLSVGIVFFLKDEMSGSLESLMAVSDYTRGVSAAVVLAVMGNSFADFGIGENTSASSGTGWTAPVAR